MDGWETLTGAGEGSDLAGAAGALTSTFVSGAGAGLLSAFGAAVVVVLTVGLPSVSMMAMTSPTCADSPAFFKSFFTVPEASAGSSTVAFSLSSTASVLSRSMASPSCLSHCSMVTSLTDSPTAGTLISTVIKILSSF